MPKVVASFGKPIAINPDVVWPGSYRPAVQGTRRRWRWADADAERYLCVRYGSARHEQCRQYSKSKEVSHLRSPPFILPIPIPRLRRRTENRDTRIRLLSALRFRNADAVARLRFGGAEKCVD